MPLHRRIHLRRLGTRVIQALLVVAGIILLVRVAWGWEASLRLAAARREIPLVSFPDDDERATQKLLADDHNAAALLMQAVHSLHIDENDLLMRSDGRPFFFGRGFGFRIDPARLHAVLQANSATLQLLDKATHLTLIRWPVNARTIEDSSSAASFALAALPLRMILASAADVAHQNADDLAALDYLQRLHGIARILDLAPDLNSHVVAAGMRSEVATTLERWDIHPAPPTVDACRQFVNTLYAGQSTTGPMIVRSFDYETSAYERWATDSFPGLSGWWLRPLALDAFARRLRLQQKIAPVAEARNWPQVLATPALAPMSRDNLNLAVLALSEPRIDIIEVMRMHFRAQCDCRASAILLAANIYHAQHHAFPASLDQLIPEYLPVAPVDPFTAADRPFHYRLDPHGPTVWSVGENGADDGGTVAPFGGTGPGPGRPGPGGGMGSMGGGYGRRYGQPDIVYGSAYRDALTLSRSF